MWISPKFQLLLVKEYQRLKEDENNRLKLEWNLQRTLSKVNYHIHTDAIKENLIPKKISPKQAQFIYADEADLLNMALFGITAKEWRERNPDKKESINALLIGQKISQSERLIQLNKTAIDQMKTLVANKAIKALTIDN